MEIRRYQPEDFGPLLDLVQACYGKHAEPPEWWRWRHLENKRQESTIWLAVEGSRVIGMRPMTIFDYCLDGKDVKGALFSAVMVHPDFRRRGVFTRLVKEASAEAWRQGATFATTMPNAQSYPAFRRIGWTDPGDRVLFVRKGNLTGRRAASSWSADVDCFPREIDVLVQRFNQSFSGLILRRDSDWLNWRFRTQPWNHYRRFVASTNADGPAGFAVTDWQTRNGIRIGYVVELVAPTEDIRGSLIRSACEALLQEGARLILTVVSPGILSRSFGREGFWRIPRWVSPKKFHTVYQVNPDCGSPESMKDIHNWYQTLGDWDGI